MNNYAELAMKWLITGEMPANEYMEYYSSGYENTVPKSMRDFHIQRWRNRGLRDADDIQKRWNARKEAISIKKFIGECSATSKARSL